MISWNIFPHSASHNWSVAIMKMKKAQSVADEILQCMHTCNNIQEEWIFLKAIADKYKRWITLTFIGSKVREKRVNKNKEHDLPFPELPPYSGLGICVPEWSRQGALMTWSPRSDHEDMECHLILGGGRARASAGGWAVVTRDNRACPYTQSELWNPTPWERVASLLL